MSDGLRELAQLIREQVGEMPFAFVLELEGSAGVVDVVATSMDDRRFARELRRVADEGVARGDVAERDCERRQD